MTVAAPRAARAWCENATLLGNVAWTYVKVPQLEFDKLEPAELADVVTVFGG